MPGEHSGSWSFGLGIHGLNLSPDGDAERFLSVYGPRILVAAQPDDHADIYILNRRNGLWSKDPGLFFGLHQARVDKMLKEFLTTRAEDEIYGFTDVEKRRVPQMIVARKTSNQAIEVAKAIGALVQQVEDRGTEESVTWWNQITRCSADEIDADMSCIAAQNGVIDLRSGALLPAIESKARLCTIDNAIPDPYRPGSEHEDIDKLVNHMPAEHGGYFFSEFGYSLHGRPTRRFLMVISPPNSGKSTIVDALTYSLGPLVGRAPREALAESKSQRSDADPLATEFVSPRRLTIMEEVEKVRISADILKERTGDAAAITYRKLYSNPVRARPTATPLLLGNQPPQNLGLSDPAVLQRCKPLPYDAVPANSIDLHLRYAWSPHDKSQKEQAEARRRRQALVARLVREAVQNPPGEPPPQPGLVREIISSWEDDELGDVGRWIIDSLTPDANGRVVIDHIWEEMVERFGQDKNGKVQGWVRSTLAKRIKSMLPELPPATRSREDGRKRSWAGWSFSPPSDDDWYAEVEKDGQAMFS